MPSFLTSLESVAGLCALGLCCFQDSFAEPDAVTWLPGAAREVSRSISGSRDTPAFEYAYGPRASLAKKLELSTRLQCRAFFSGAFIACPGIDLALRWKATKHVNPFLSAFAEGLFARPESARDGYLIRGMGGLTFPGREGEFALLASVDNGNGKGLLVNRRETRISGGMRYAPLVRRR